MGVDTLIAGGTLLTADGLREVDLAIDDGSIAAVGTADAMPTADETVDATGRYVLPGVVDPHVHIDEAQGRVGTYASETRAAALGGVTTIVDFAWQGGDRDLETPDATLMDGIRHKQEQGREAVVDFGLHGAVTMADPAVLDEFEAAVAAGVTSFKSFMSTYRVGVSNGFIDRVMRRVADLDAVAMVHTEDPSVCETRAETFREEGRTDPVWFARSRPDYAEAMAAEDAARMAVEAGANYYGVHTSSAAALAALEWFQDAGGNVRAETCPQYLVLDESAHESRGNLAKVAPSLKSPADREALFEGIASGSVSVVGTDHVAYPAETKTAGEWWDSPFGFNGLQWSLPVTYDALVERRGFHPSVVVRTMCSNPAKLFGMPWKGTLEPGTDADVVLFDPDATTTIDAAGLASNADFTMYEGRTVTGAVDRTFVRGTPVAADGSVVAPDGHGEFVACETPDWSALP